MNQDVSAWFRISNLTDGQNELPAESFVVTDNTLSFQGLTAGTSDQYYNIEDVKADYELTAADYVMDELNLYKSVNGDNSHVLATVEAEVNEKWTSVEGGNDIDLTALADGSCTTVKLPEGATGYKVSYENVGPGFKAGDIEVKITFKQRPSDETMPEIRKIINKATLNWEDTKVDHEGKPGSHGVFGVR